MKKFVMEIEEDEHESIVRVRSTNMNQRSIATGIVAAIANMKNEGKMNNQVILGIAESLFDVIHGTENGFGKSIESFEKITKN